MFYDLHVHTAASIGENKLQEMAEMAKRLGLDGIAVVSYFPDVTEIKPVEGIDIMNAVMLKPASAGELDKLISKARPNAELIYVHGGNYDINRAACESSAVDMLCHPELGRKDSGIDHIVIKSAAANNVAIELNFREILESHGRNRSNILSSMRTNIMLAGKYEAKIIAVSGAVNIWGMRAGRELAAFLNLMGMDLGESLDAMSNVPKKIIAENREKLLGKRREGVIEE
ncbi:MAG: hypothetical protein HY513_01120 [Candidatus Aenigmarchaeota archaeon]|nr:hypothetical protein [Candidatus Aenigmarchaeota archaeon]